MCFHESAPSLSPFSFPLLTCARSAVKDVLYLYGGVDQEGADSCAEGLFHFTTGMAALHAPFPSFYPPLAPPFLPLHLLVLLALTPFPPPPPPPTLLSTLFPHSSPPFSDPNYVYLSLPCSPSLPHTETNTWTVQNTSGPAPRALSMSGILCEGKMITFGGVLTGKGCNSVHILDIGELSFSSLSLDCSPPLSPSLPPTLPPLLPFSSFPIPFPPSLTLPYPLPPLPDSPLPPSPPSLTLPYPLPPLPDSPLPPSPPP